MIPADPSLQNRRRQVSMQINSVTTYWVILLLVSL
jgi:hypothetical protein